MMVTQVPADPASRDRVAALLAGPSAVPGRRDPAAGAPVLVVVGGLPATGKSTVASALARQAGFAFVRVDRIEQAIIDSACRASHCVSRWAPSGTRSPTAWPRSSSGTALAWWPSASTLSA